MPSTPHHHDGVIVGIDAIDQGQKGGRTNIVRLDDAHTAEHPVRDHAGATGNTPPPADSARPPDNSTRVPGITSRDIERVRADYKRERRSMGIEISERDVELGVSLRLAIEDSNRRLAAQMAALSAALSASVADYQAAKNMKAANARSDNNSGRDISFGVHHRGDDIYNKLESPAGLKPPPATSTPAPPDVTDLVDEECMITGYERGGSAVSTTTDSPPCLKPPPTDTPGRHEQHNLVDEAGIPSAYECDGNADSGAHGIINSGRDVEFGVYQRRTMGGRTIIVRHDEAHDAAVMEPYVIPPKRPLRENNRLRDDSAGVNILAAVASPGAERRSMLPPSTGAFSDLIAMELNQPMDDKNNNYATTDAADVHTVDGGSNKSTDITGVPHTEGEPNVEGESTVSNKPSKCPVGITYDRVGTTSLDAFSRDVVTEPTSPTGTKPPPNASPQINTTHSVVDEAAMLSAYARDGSADSSNMVRDNATNSPSPISSLATPPLTHETLPPSTPATTDATADFWIKCLTHYCDTLTVDNHTRRTAVGVAVTLEEIEQNQTALRLKTEESNRKLATQMAALSAIMAESQAEVAESMKAANARSDTNSGRDVSFGVHHRGEDIYNTLESPAGLKPPPATSTPAQPDVTDLVDEECMIPGYERGGSVDSKTTDSPPGLKPPPTDAPGRHKQHNLVDEAGIPSAYGCDGNADSGAHGIINSGRDVEFGVYQQPPPTKTSSVPPTTIKNNIASAREQVEAVRRWEAWFAEHERQVKLFDERTAATLDVSSLRAEDREPALRKTLADQCLAADKAADKAAQVATERERAVRTAMSNYQAEREPRIAMSGHQAATTTPAMAAASVSTAPRDDSTATPPSTTYNSLLDGALPAPPKWKLANTSSPHSNPSLLNTGEVERRDFVTELAQEVAQQIKLELATTSAPPSVRNKSTDIDHGRAFVAATKELDLQVVMPSTPPTAPTSTLTSAPPTPTHTSLAHMDTPSAQAHSPGKAKKLERDISVPTIPSMPTNADSTTTIFGLGVTQFQPNPPSALEDISWYASTTIGSAGTPPATLTWLTLASFVDMAPTMNTFSFAEALSWIKTARITNADPTINTFSIVEALSWLMKATFANFDFATTTFSIVEALSWLMKANYNTFHHAQSPPSKGPHHLLHHTLGLFF